MDNTVLKSIRDTYGKTLADLGKIRDDVVVIDCDLSCSTQTKHFKEVFPERFFNVGIAEQNAMTVAAGLACAGKVPFVSAFAVFASGRAWEQIRNGICYSNLNVKIVATHGGVTVGEDGATHQALEDVAIMRTIPGLTVIVPADATETREVIKTVADYKGPVYVRLSRANLPEVFEDGKYKFNMFKAVKLREGKDVTIVANGETTFEALKAAKILAEEGIDVEVLHYPVVKPFDKETLIESAKKTNKVVTVEDHSVIGGLGGAVCEILSENHPVKVLRLGTNDEFGQSGKAIELMEYYGLTGEKIVQKVKEFLR